MYEVYDLVCEKCKTYLCLCVLMNKRARLISYCTQDPPRWSTNHTISVICLVCQGQYGLLYFLSMSCVSAECHFQIVRTEMNTTVIPFEPATYNYIKNIMLSVCYVNWPDLSLTVSKSSPDTDILFISALLYLFRNNKALRIALLLFLLVANWAMERFYC